MRRPSGFTLVEIMVVIVILGILGATALPFYQTIQQRAYGGRAVMIVRQLLDAEIIYYLERNKFFPHDPDATYTVKKTGETQPAGVDVLKEIEDALGVVLPIGHLRYDLVGINVPPNEKFIVTISADFSLFKGGFTSITAWVDKQGNMNFIVPD